MRDELALLDWKRRVFALYAALREDPDPEAAWGRWRETRDRLFAEHPQSPIPAAQRAGFSGLFFYDYDPALRVAAELRETEPRRYEIGTSGDGTFAFRRFAVASFGLGGADCELELYWLEGYGGGVFLPFADATSGEDTYGAGRYLLDSVKGADLGIDADGRMPLDFNLAYNPSCSYDPAWVCPLAPPPNRLAVAVEAGERISVAHG